MWACSRTEISEALTRFRGDVIQQGDPFEGAGYPKTKKVLSETLKVKLNQALIVELSHAARLPVFHDMGFSCPGSQVTNGKSAGQREVRVLFGNQKGNLRQLVFLKRAPTAGVRAY